MLFNRKGTMSSTQLPYHHPSALEPGVLILNVVLGVVGAIIGMQLITQLGITPNTSIIGALVAMLLARIPLSFLRGFRSIHRQNLVQTSISGATFGAANSLLLPIGIPYLLGRQDLVWPMLIGAAAGMFTDAWMLWRVFDSRAFPGSAAWPPGVASAEAIRAGDEGGQRARLLIYGIAGGLLGSYLKIPMSAFGVAFIGNMWALAMFGVGLLIRGYSTNLFGIDLNALYIPHGVMVGAGTVALIQILAILRGKVGNQQEAEAKEEVELTTDDATLARTIRMGFGLYIVFAALLAVLSGLHAQMSPAKLVLWVVFAAFSCLAAEVIVGLSAMHAGWFPAFATTLIFLVLGMILGFPEVPLALLTGYIASGGPAFADMGYDLKAGWLLRRRENNPDFERAGRFQQYLANNIAFVVALIMVAISWRAYFSQDLFPPVDRVFVATIKAGLEDPSIAMRIFLWAIPGAAIQFIGGPARQLGILLATGLLILNPNAGWAVLAGLLIRFLVSRKYGEKANSPMEILAAGFIAGDALYGFFNSVLRLRK
ncbi:MAG TPA: OPT/YSL family transporter [Symbiobacteriaceae bacterium]